MATTDLTRTPSSGGNRKTWTFSAWLKRASKSDANNSRIFSAGGSQTDYTSWFMYAVNGTDGALQLQNRISNSTTALKTNRKFRDVNGWYHLVIACDTTQATASNRIKIYVNGVQETSFSTEQYPAQDADTFVNHTVEHNIGSADGTTYTPRYWAGSMSHVALVDGQQLTPTSFGLTDSTTGQWKFKSPSLTWGTNGFHLKFENSGNMGLDSSGQTNNYTVSGGTLTQSIDTPSNSYCTLNPFHSQSEVGGATFFHGNLKIETTAQGGGPYTGTTGTTMAFNKGKWYWEVKLKTAASTYPNVGVGEATQPITGANNYLDDVTNFNNINLSCYGTTGNFRRTGRSTQNLNVDGGFSVNDIVMVAFDYDNDKIWFGKNGTWFASGNPSTGANANETGFISAITPNDDYVMPYIGDGNYATSCGFEVNFGSGFFGQTAITSAGSNGNGSLFEYDVPTGFYALNTKNLNTYG